MKSIFFLSITLLLFALPSAAQDISGSSDHPLITRYPGSVIEYYEVQEHIPYSIATGPVTGFKKIDEWKNTEGKRTRIYYSLKGTSTLTEVYRNYFQALEKNGFKILAQGIDDKNNVSKEIGGSGFLNVMYEKNPFPNSKGIKLLQGSASSGGTCYIAASNKNIYVVLSGKQYNAGEKVFLLDVIEEKAMKDDLIRVNAAEMKNALDRDGKIALYGIYFDFDKAEIQSESENTLKEISKLLTENPKLQLYVVGHTDMKGTHEYNINLSRKRAEAVVGELVKNHGISTQRLTPDGVGFLAPVATNVNEEGRKLNRRVELVQK